MCKRPRRPAPTTNTGTITTAAPTSSSAPAGAPAGQPSSCQVNPATAPVPTHDPDHPVPGARRISVALSGVTSGSVTPGSAPTEVDVTLCNGSAVSYPTVGVVLGLQRCTCAPGEGEIPRGTVERFDPATGGWTRLQSPAMGTGMDYLGGFLNVQAMPKGKAVTLRYRITLDGSMTDGQGGVSAAAVLPGSPIELGKADLPFTVSTGSTTPPNGPTPTPASRQTVLPFTGLTYPNGVAVDTAGNVYLTDGTTVVKLAAGANTQTVLPFTGLRNPFGVAVDTAGNVYVADDGNNQVVKLTAGSTTQTVFPLTGPNGPNDRGGVAVDSAGNVYVLDGRQVLKFAPGSSAASLLPFTGLNGPESLAVNAAGDIYVLDHSGFGRVVKLAAH